jgi:hypothetical protein
MPSFDIESLDIASLDIEFFDMLSFFIESLDIESLDIESFDIVSFFTASSAKAVGASASPNDKVAADRMKAVRLIMTWQSPGKACSGLATDVTPGNSNAAVACYALGKAFDHKGVNDSACTQNNDLRRTECVDHIIVLGEMHLRQVNSRPMTAPTWTRSLAEAR